MRKITRHTLVILAFAAVAGSAYVTGQDNGYADGQSDMFRTFCPTADTFAASSDTFRMADTDDCDRTELIYFSTLPGE